jgi:hypothetical protein
MPQRARRADSNQPEIVEVFRKLGASFQHTHTIPGALDGIVGYLGIDQRVEIKDGSKKPSLRRLTEDEQTTFDTWKGRAPVIITSPEEAQDLLAQMRQEAIHAPNLRRINRAP